MKMALEALRDGVKFNETSRNFQIPKPTLRRHYQQLNKFAKEGMKHTGLKKKSAYNCFEV
jgi:hypothetical protein